MFENLILCLLASGKEFYLKAASVSIARSLLLFDASIFIHLPCPVSRKSRIYKVGKVGSLHPFADPDRASKHNRNNTDIITELNF